MMKASVSIPSPFFNLFKKFFIYLLTDKYQIILKNIKYDF